MTVTWESKEKFFFTRNYPHRWTSGPDVSMYNDDLNGLKFIQSLEEAKELAEKYHVGGSTKDTCHTRYGIIYELDEEG